MTTIFKDGYYIPKSLQSLDINKIKSDLTVEPFLIQKYKKQNIKFNIYKETDTYIIVPKYYGIKLFGLPKYDKENEGEHININFTGTLRELQINIINDIIPYINNNYGGILCLPCGTGKTIIALYLIAYFKVKTLIIVHKTFLLEQWCARIREFTNASIGIIQQKKQDVKNNDIVIGMLQSIAKEQYDNNIFKDFGMVIFDEAHHAPSQYFSKALPIISCKRTIGLSATPTRADKLDKILYWYFGDIMYKCETATDIPVNVKCITFDIEHPKFKELKLYNGDINRAATINKIITIGRRNKLIIDNIVEVLKLHNRKIIVLSDRIKHLELLKKRLDTYNVCTSDYYIGGMKQEALNKSENADVIFATYTMASEALDIPSLNTLFMVTPRVKIEQSVGRILRKIDLNSIPMIFDFIDNLPSFVRASIIRKRFYKSKNFTIKSINNNCNNECNDDNDDNDENSENTLR